MPCLWSSWMGLWSSWMGRYGELSRSSLTKSQLIFRITGTFLLILIQFTSIYICKCTDSYIYIGLWYFHTTISHYYFTPLKMWTILTILSTLYEHVQNFGKYYPHMSDLRWNWCEGIFSHIRTCIMYVHTNMIMVMVMYKVQTSLILMEYICYSITRFQWHLFMFNCFSEICFFKR